MSPLCLSPEPPETEHTACHAITHHVRGHRDISKHTSTTLKQQTNKSSESHMKHLRRPPVWDTAQLHYQPHQTFCCHWLNEHNTSTGSARCSMKTVPCDILYVCLCEHYFLTLRSCTEHLIPHRQAHGDSRAVQPLHVLHRPKQPCLAIHSTKSLHTFKELNKYT